MKKTLKFSTFLTEKLPGSPQFIHNCDDLDEWKQLKHSYQVKDEYDHSFLIIQADQTLIYWKNKNGLIQFCGSGAFASMAYLFELDEKLLLRSDNLLLKGSPTEKGIELQIPAKGVKACGKFLQGEGSQIFLLECEDKVHLEQASWQVIADQLNLDRPGGLCLFYWDQKNSWGALRYFTPWYGREEDYVTGSIHQFLSPFVSKKYGVDHQRWQQLSSSSGILYSRTIGEQVFISGRWQNRGH